MRRLRTLALAALLAPLSLSPSPASAGPIAVAFIGTAHIDCFGCGPTSCSASLDLLGGTHTGTASTTACNASEPGGVGCLVSGTANGTIVGTSGTVRGLTLDFNWTRVGPLAVYTLSGNGLGAGEALFIPTSVTCGAPADATILGFGGCAETRGESSPLPPPGTRSRDFH